MPALLVLYVVVILLLFFLFWYFGRGEVFCLRVWSSLPFVWWSFWLGCHEPRYWFVFFLVHLVVALQFRWIWVNLLYCLFSGCCRVGLDLVVWFWVCVCVCACMYVHVLCCYTYSSSVFLFLLVTAHNSGSLISLSCGRSHIVWRAVTYCPCIIL